ncbi:MAG: COX15/CtaA family protein [Gammaproteobacteria bacterium]|nr:COX15/CtaA family protein [Gammaproteobacteria bacterium]MCH9763240.1 COX15/CtaA family protein [Gammaproteobacteria bacterium]
MSLRTIRWTVSIVLLLALFVVMLGAYTRLTDAGLGCPDWPGCYGKMVLPSATDAARVNAQASFPELPIESRKAWTEMAHRYAAGTLGMLILGVAAAASFGPKTVRMSPLYPIVLVGLLLFQAALGMWTVTLQLLPVVVMGHLLGGMTLAALLAWFRWHVSAVEPTLLPKLRVWGGLGIAVVAIQIILGGWVSANYAGLACIGFPTCNQHWLPVFDWAGAFDIFSPVGANYQGGALDLAARVTIQWVHRVWALVTALYVIGFVSCLFCHTSIKSIRRVAVFALGLVVLQCMLGIFNVVYMLPLVVAVLHNGVALLLLISMVSLFYLLSGRRV